MHKLTFDKTTCFDVLFLFSELFVSPHLNINIG